ncbi:hypothetical protein AKJ61_02315 [candidate division MSBL1 archaeon SCGC-AAA259B11]|uniref:Hydantoinase/oxoprolinase N-terminal domain-containing protein n=1 Tax=candidate division MSBL1 archaeon SCGC-AAA259B11 TaxID=1698260 RepID=A0A133U659_9EURY|nr:hypothetical protein AKJ61_02315 [candidate division MSBL1 archaeon SCGC-AAA259B11]
MRMGIDVGGMNTDAVILDEEGGSIFVRDLRGASRIAKPTHYEVADAIGAAVSQVSGEIDRIFSLEGKTREEVLEGAKESAREEAIEAGAEDVVEVR